MLGIWGYSSFNRRWKTGNESCRGRSWQDSSLRYSNLAELECWRAAVVFDVLELKLLVSTQRQRERVNVSGSDSQSTGVKDNGNERRILFALCVKIDPGDGSFDLVKTDIVEALETSSGYCAHAMVGDQKVLLPAHEDMIALGEIPIGEIRFFGLSGQRSPCWKPSPVVHVCFLGRTP